MKPFYLRETLGDIYYQAPFMEGKDWVTYAIDLLLWKWNIGWHMLSSLVYGSEKLSDKPTL